MTPATEKAAPIPAAVRKVAEGFCKKHAWHRSYVNDLAADLWSAILTDRTSQEERIREDERDRLRALAFEQMMAETSDALDEDEGSFALSFLIRHGALTHEDRARLRGGAS